MYGQDNLVVNACSRATAAQCVDVPQAVERTLSRTARLKQSPWQEHSASLTELLNLIEHEVLD